MESLNYGITNFDNIFRGYITMFQATTLEGWYSIMTMFMDGYSIYVSAMIFIVAISVCHYLLMNLTLAVLVQNLQN